MTDFNESLDIVICLSLERRKDRRQKISEQWSSLKNLSLVPNIDVEFFNAFTPDTCLVPGSWTHRPSYYATNLGHLKILESLWLRKDWNYALILEDDALFTPEFNKINTFWKIVNKYYPDWLALFLGGVYQRDPKLMCPGVNLNFGSTQSHAYVVNRPGVYRLYDHLWCTQHRVCDWAYSDMMVNDYCVYSPDPWMITTSEGYSDNIDCWKEQGT